MMKKNSIPLFLLAATLAGCDSSETAENTSCVDLGDGAVYLVHSAVEGPDGRSNYFTLTTRLDGGELDYGTSLPLMGRPRLYAQEGLGFFAIANAETKEITKYQVGDDGCFEKGDSINLATRGVTSMGAQAVHFASATRAYYKDPGEGQVIVWNPTEMVIDATIPLPESLVREGWLTSYGDWVARDGEAFFTVSWTSPTYDRVAAGTALVRIDPATNELTVTEDLRCRGIETAGEVDGTLYFFSGVINIFGYNVYGEDGGQQDCILRIAPGAKEFDADWVGSLSDALPENVAATAAAITADGEVWAQVADLDTAPSEPGSTYGEWYAADWSWWHLQMPSLAEPVQAPTQPGAYSSFIVTSEDGFFISQTASDYSETTLMELSGPEPKAGVNMPGFILDIARVR